MVGLTLASVNARLARLPVGLRDLVWAVALAVLALILSFVPLFDLLGYDFALAVGLATAFAAVDIGQGRVARWRRRHPEAQADARLVLRLVGEAVAVTAGALVLPVLVSLANSARPR